MDSNEGTPQDVRESGQLSGSSTGGLPTQPFRDRDQSLTLQSQTVGENTPRAAPATKKCMRYHEVPVSGRKRVCDECRMAEPGLCIVCKRAPRRNGLMSCETCSLVKSQREKRLNSRPGRRERITQMAKQASERALEKGLCRFCRARQLRPGKTSCEPCALKHARLGKERRGRQAISSQTKDAAKKVAERKRLLYNTRKSQGLCPDCGDKASDGRVKCERCRQKGVRKPRTPETIEKQLLQARRRYAEALEKGLCRACKHRPSRPGTTVCELCAPEVARQEAMEETRTTNGQELLETSLEDADRMVIDQIMD